MASLAMTTSIESTNAPPLEFVTVSGLGDVNNSLLSSAVKVYQAAFARAPYFELFSDSDVHGALQMLLDRRGDLIFGTLQGETQSLAGGYPLLDGTNCSTYHIEELAVSPDCQKRGYGRATLSALRSLSQRTHPHTREELRTTRENVKALSLYESEGFVKEDGYEIVAQRRQDGRVALDPRIHLSCPAISIQERLMIIHRLVVVSPSGNTTAVVFDQLFLNQDREQLQKKIEQSWKKQDNGLSEIEQCCFVTLPRNSIALARVEMFGGEFCGNATRSVIWLLTEGKDSEGVIEVSGVARPLAFSVKQGVVSVEMPIKAGNLVEKVEEGTLVHLDGITHLVVGADSRSSPRQLLESLLGSNKYQCSEYPAFGVSRFNRSTGEAQFCVWVKGVNSIFDETACGSGTCSIGVVLADEIHKPLTLNVKQPSGSNIQAIVEYQEDRICRAFIAGTVNVLYDGKFNLGQN